MLVILLCGFPHHHPCLKRVFLQLYDFAILLCKGYQQPASYNRDHKSRKEEKSFNSGRIYTFNMTFQKVYAIAPFRCYDYDVNVQITKGINVHCENIIFEND